MKRSQLAEDMQKLKLIIGRVDAPPEIVYQNLEKRAKAINLESKSDAERKVYLKMKSSNQEISRNYFRVDTSGNIAPVIGKFVHTMNQ